jgi:hypothetical protein
MKNAQHKHGRSVGTLAGSTLRWITGFDPFGPYAPANS